MKPVFPKHKPAGLPWYEGGCVVIAYTRGTEEGIPEYSQRSCHVFKQTKGKAQWVCTECGSIASMSNRGVFTIVLSETLEAYRLKAELT